MGETERLTSIPYTNPMGSDHMGVLLDTTPNHWRYSNSSEGEGREGEVGEVKVGVMKL